jgi:hypothetical protein
MSFREELRFNPFEKYERYVEEISKKFNYTSRQQTLLLLMIPALIQVQGEQNEQTILDTLRNVPLVEVSSGTTMYDVLQEYKNKDIERRNRAGFVNDGDMKRAVGVYHSSPILGIDKNGQICIVGRNRVVAYRMMSQTYDMTSIVTASHEITHAIKNNNLPYQIEKDDDGSDILIERVGLILSKSTIKKEGESFILEEIGESGTGIEEGLTVLDEEKIVNVILGYLRQYGNFLTDEQKSFFAGIDINKEYISSSYMKQKAIARYILESGNLASLIPKVQMSGDNDLLIRTYNDTFADGRDHWAKIMELTDESLLIHYDKFAHMFGLEEWIKVNGQKEKANMCAIKEEILGYRNAYDSDKTRRGENIEQGQ